MICILYALIGIPLNAMLIGSLGNLFKVSIKQCILKMNQMNPYKNHSGPDVYFQGPTLGEPW